MSIPITTEPALAEAIAPAELLSAVRDDMYALYDRYYAQATRGVFESDLNEKDLVILVRAIDSRAVRGFSTLRRLSAVVNAQPIAAFYSGDTIVDRSAWGQVTLQRAWARTVWAEASGLPDARVYWFLTSCAHRTYRFLPLFFQRFYPSYSAEMPDQVRTDWRHFGQMQFGDQFDPKTGIVHFSHPAPVREGMADFAASRQDDPHLKFFASANPGFERGEGLACIAELRESNLTPAALRVLR